jgi:hypothetical protein
MMACRPIGSSCGCCETSFWRDGAWSPACSQPCPPCTPLIAGSAITGPVAKECADLWPRVAAAANTIV